jgi:CRP/FNR family transcriptional regulator, cyclic AMP receptor protein
MSDGNQNLFEKYGHVYDEGKIIFREKEEGTQMFIVQEGSVRISKNMGGKEHTLAVLGKGEFFGEMAIVNRVKRTASATAMNTVKLLAFDRTGFIKMIEKNAKIALNVIDKLCRRLAQANQQIQHLVKGNEPGIVAMNLYYAFQKSGNQGVVEFGKTTRELSLSLEISQDVIIRYCKEFEAKGVLEIDENNMRIVDREQLAQAAGIVAPYPSAVLGPA